MSEAKRWCFTLNNYSEEEYNLFELLEWSYLIIGKEKGKEGTPHLQGYIELKKARRLTALKKENLRVHWEKLKGLPWQAANYCKKEGDFREWGKISVPEKNGKNDVKFGDIVSKFKAGGMRGIMEDPPKLSSLRLLEKWATYLEPERTTKPYVHWIWGASGTGKSKLANTYPDKYWKDDTKWWDGYDGQKTVVLDDFRGSQMKFTYLLRLLDRYPMRLEVKGGYRQMTSINVIITSIIHPKNCYFTNTDDEYGEPIQQLIRRIDLITETNEKNIFCDEVITGDDVMFCRDALEECG